MKKIIKFEIKINEIHTKMLENGQKILEAIDETQKVLKKINKIIGILTNKKLHQIKNFIMMIMDIIQTIILIRTLNLAKGIKSINFSVLKKLFLAKTFQEIIKKVLNTIQNLCAI